MAMNGNEGGSAYPPNPDVKSGSCLIAGFQPLTVVHPSYWNAYKTESTAGTRCVVSKTATGSAWASNGAWSAVRLGAVEPTRPRRK